MKTFIQYMSENKYNFGKNDKSLHGRYDTESGHYTVNDKGYHFNNSGYKQSFTHEEMSKLHSGKQVREFKVNKNHPGHIEGVNHVISIPGSEDHYVMPPETMKDYNKNK